MITIPLGRGAALGTLEIDNTRFSDAVNTYIYEYGLRQVINDAMAEKKDEDGKPLPNDQIVAKAQKRLDNLYAGTLRQRGDAEPADPIEAELYRLAKAAIHDTYKRARFYASVPKGTKDRLLHVANGRRKTRGLEPLDDVVTVVKVFLDTSPTLTAAGCVPVTT